MRRENYRHTQTGYPLIIALGGALAFALYVTMVTCFLPLALAVVALFGFLLIVFSSLNVEVDDSAVEVWFGPLPWRRRIPLSQVTAARVVHNPWYLGWGIRWIPGGWLFNVSGGSGVELRLEPGGRFRIGTDAPHDLARALEVRGIPILKAKPPL